MCRSRETFRHHAGGGDQETLGVSHDDGVDARQPPTRQTVDERVDDLHREILDARRIARAWRQNVQHIAISLAEHQPFCADDPACP
jgi:hypothetical protein